MMTRMTTYREGDSYRYAHLKRDGYSLRMRKDAYGRVSFWTRLTDVTEQVRAYPWYAAAVTRVANGQVVVGELWRPGQRASYVRHGLVTGDSQMRWDPFVVETMPADAPLEVVADACTAWGLSFIPFESPGDASLARGPLPPDVEGYVFKNGNALDWAKWKPSRTIDLVVYDVKDGNGKYLGLVGALECGVHVRDRLTSLPRLSGVARVSGMTDAERIEMSDAVGDVVGRVVEVEYQYVGSGGRLRHPRFVRFRDDKPARECTPDQDPQLKEWFDAMS